MQLAPCTELRLETLTNAGKIPQETDFFIEDSTIYYLDDVTDSELLEQIDSALKLNLSKKFRSLVLGQRANDKYRQAVQKIRGAQGLSARLLAAVGAQSIRQRLPAGLLQAVQAEQIQVDDLRLADLAMVVYGIDVLHAFREDLEQAGLEPPSRWAGGAIARKFVRDLGFPKEYAGFQEVRRDPLLEVEGPPNLPRTPLISKESPRQHSTINEWQWEETWTVVTSNWCWQDTCHGTGAYRTDKGGRVQRTDSMGGSD